MKTISLTQKDIDILFYKPAKKDILGLFWLWFKPVLLFLFLYLLCFFLLNAKALTSKANYYWKYDILKEYRSKKMLKAEYYLPTIQNSAQNNNIANDNITNNDNNKLIIPRLDKTVPIVWNVKWDNISMNSDLKNGVIHLDGTSLPNQIGNVFISGHSSYNYWDKTQKYGNVFANLDRMQNGDLVKLTYNFKEYDYEVYSKVIVDKYDTTIVTAKDFPTLTLMTCTPTGTNFKRLAVQAKLISPIQTNINASLKPLPSFLPIIK